jgi:hypothetical protein
MSLGEASIVEAIEISNSYGTRLAPDDVKVR